MKLCAAVAFLLVSAVTAASCADEPIELQPGPHVQFELQAALINAVPGDTIQLAAGTYRLKTELNVVCDNITLKGAGPEKTILSFKGQAAGSSGIVSTGNAFVIEDLAVEDTVGNAIKTLGAKDVTFRNVRVEWTNGPSSSNGAYGIYPVECQNVLIENCSSIGASDAGIYVGQSQDVIVRGCLARQNVAGIEIENTLRADVYNNTATDNSGGILVFDLPGLNITNGGQVRVYDNKIEGNNHVNFAPKGTMVSDVPAGSGIMLMATDHVEIFDNDITNHQTANIVVVSFLITERKINDKKYDPYPEATSIHDNRISKGGFKPAGQIGTLLSPLMGGQFPDIFFDGLVDGGKLQDGKLPPELQLSIHDNGEATFANVNIGDFSPTNVLTGRYKIERDLAAHAGKLKPLPAARLQPHASAGNNTNPAVAVYRAAPQQLSDWKLFEMRDGHWQQAADNFEYDLNTPLFSDHTSKHRYVRLPEGASMTWHEAAALEFPVGTVIAKTFAYPDSTDDATADERFVETRIEHRNKDGWYGYSYIWNEDQSDAVLSLGGGVVDVAWKDEHGKQHTNAYQVPNANQCLSCHSQSDQYVPLGPTARNLNRPGVHSPHNQLASWIESGQLQDAPPIAARPALARYDHPETGSLNDRARAWLEVNCAHCHNPAGSARTSGLDLRTVQTDPGRYGVMKSPVAAGKGSGGRRYDIVPGKPDESILMFRIETDEPGARMPNLARSMNHPESAQLIRDWIAGMKPEGGDAGE
ncbi:MAG: right-handed parallel beta-helix repeat-containing protein [Planctomycetaceae bacterium]|nr:right-handed parallel beta-helix repeat-containing protein [Planctomycetaceae bacterium]